MEFEQTISKWLNYFRETVELSYDKENVIMMHTAAEGTGTVRSVTELHPDHSHRYNDQYRTWTKHAHLYVKASSGLWEEMCNSNHGLDSWTSWLVQNEFFICLFVCLFFKTIKRNKITSTLSETLMKDLNGVGDCRMIPPKMHEKNERKLGINKMPCSSSDESCRTNKQL